MLWTSLKKLSKNKIFLDLGCGNSWKIGASIADVVGASAYLGVDKFNVGNSITNIDGKDYTPQDISAIILQKLKQNL